MLLEDVYEDNKLFRFVVYDRLDLSSCFSKLWSSCLQCIKVGRLIRYSEILVAPSWACGYACYWFVTDIGRSFW